MDLQETKAFLKEREDKLGSPILWKTYATWYAELCGDVREFGVFLYTDGRVLIAEDFERAPSIMGIPVPALKRKSDKYIKKEECISLQEIKSIDTVTRSSAERSLKRLKDSSKSATTLDKIFRKLATKITTANKIYFIEVMDRKEFKSMIKRYQEENYGSI